MERESFEIRPLYSRIIRKVPLPYPFTLIISGMLFVFLGVILSYYYGIGDKFIVFWQTYVFIAATVWVAGVACWCFDSYYNSLMSIYPEFEIDEKEYQKLIVDHFKYVTNTKNWLKVSIPFILLFGYFLFLIRAGQIGYPGFRIILSPSLLFVYYMILMIFGIFEGFSGAMLLAKMTLFVREISNIPLNIGFNANRRPLITNLTKFSVAASVTWFFGVFLMFIVTVTTRDIYTIAVSLFTIVVGFFTFLVPQWFIYSAIKRAKTKKLEGLEEELNTAYNNLLKNEYPNERLLAMFTLFDEIEKIKEYPFNFGQGITVLVSSLPAIITTFIR